MFIQPQVYSISLLIRFKRWDFPNCLGAIDGKHVIQKPNHGGSEFHNYKGSESIVLMAICDSAYKFTICDIGQSGSHSDGGIWEDSTFGKALHHGRSRNMFFLLISSRISWITPRTKTEIACISGRINLPEDEPLPGSDDTMPFVFVGDEAFPLRPYLTRPWPGRMLTDEKRKVYDYRLSRARQVVENTFG